MGISAKNFLNRYFGADQLKEPLANIGLPVGSTKKERIDRIIENWSSYNRDWYDLLNYLDWGTLAQICEDFNIMYSEYAKEDTLRNKIADERILDFRKKQKSSTQKKSYESISSNPIFHMPHNKRDWGKIGVILTIIIGLGFGIPSLYYSMNPSLVIIPESENSIRTLDAEFTNEIEKILPESKDKKISVSSVLGDQEAFQFATEIKEFLVLQGWKVSGVNQIVYSEPIIGVSYSIEEDGNLTLRIGSNPNE